MDYNPSPPELKNTLPSDKRIYPRINSKVNLRYKVFKTEGELIKRGVVPEQLSVCRNISAGGLLFVSDVPLNVGAILDLTIELPDAEAPIEALVRVVRTEESSEEGKFDTAVCFLDITGAQRSRLNKFVEEGS